MRRNSSSSRVRSFWSWLTTDCISVFGMRQSYHSQIGLKTVPADGPREPATSAELVAVFCLFFCNGGTQFRRETSPPCLPVLSAEPLPAGRLPFCPLTRHMDVKDRLPEPISVQWAFHSGSDLFLKGGTEKWLLSFREANAVRREYGLGLENLLSLFNSPQQRSDSHSWLPCGAQRFRW
jgi:hypothetical protein